MTIIIKQLISLFKLLHSDKGGRSIAAGVAAGMILGFAPVLSLQSVLVFVCLFLFRIQMGAAFTLAFFFAFIAWILDPVFHSVGVVILEMESLKPTWTALYNMPIVPFTRFYNSVVMGAGVVSLALVPVVYWGSLKLIAKYRDTVGAKFSKSKLWTAIKASSLYQWYEKYEQLTNS